MLSTTVTEGQARAPRKRSRFWTSPWLLLLLLLAALPWIALPFRDSEAESIAFEVRPPGFSIQRSGHGEEEVAEVSMAGYYTPRQQDQGVALPRRGFLVALPPEGSDFVVTTEGLGEGLNYDLVKPASQGQQGVFLPALAELQETSYFRTQRVGLIQVSPLQYNAANGQLKYYQRIKVKVTPAKRQATQLVKAPGLKDSAEFEALLSQTVANYAQGKKWRVRPAPPAGLPPPALVTAANEGRAFRLEVASDGIYEVSYDDLLKAGLKAGQAGLRPRLFLEGQEAALESSEERFGPGSTLRFFGEKRRSRYGESNVYWLALGTAPGRQIVAEEAAPGTTPVRLAPKVLHLEENKQYRGIVPRSDETEHWYWDFLQSLAGQETSKEFRFEVGVEPNAGERSALTLAVVGFPVAGAELEYRVAARVNGEAAGEWTWENESPQRLESELPAGVLKRGTNTLTLTAPKRSPGEGSAANTLLFLDWFEVQLNAPLQAVEGNADFRSEGGRTYAVSGLTDAALVYDVSEPLAPRRLRSEGGAEGLRFQGAQAGQRRYVAAELPRLRRPGITQAPPLTALAKGQGADYIIIAPSQFNPALAPLVSHYADKGLRVQSIEPQALYDAFAAGLQEPLAIQRFLAYTMSTWPGAPPSHVLLAGDGHLDFKDYLKSGEPNLVPPYLSQVDPFLGETSADNRFAAVLGTDSLPDLMLGRLPAGTAQELSNMVQKILAAERLPASGGRQTLFIADNPDAAGDFRLFSDTAAEPFEGSTYGVQKLYFSGGREAVAGTRSEIVRRWSGGLSLVSFIGHAAIPSWTHEDIFNAEDAAKLPASAVLPVVLALTCYDGYWQYPGLPSTSEVLLRNPGGGAVASFTASGLAVGTGHDILGRAFVAQLVRGGSSLGAATLAAKLTLFSTTHEYRDLLDTFGLLGDPGMRAP